ncbi:MAG: SH3 domain-containing protein [Melioribacteraceae bacterium]|nr:SH3 domain-containing protein [Melioribacteraceae bacterium]
MKNIKIILSIILLVLITTSCDLFFSGNNTIVYIVNTKKLNIREEPTEKAKIVGEFAKGDTIVPTKKIKDWVQFIYNKDTAYVFSKNLLLMAIPTEVIEKKEALLLPEPGLSIKNLFDEYGRWDKLSFWGITIAMSILTVVFMVIGIELDKKLMQFKGKMRHKGENFIPYLFGALGFLFGIAYAFGEMEILKLIFIDHFWWLPEGQGFLAWYLWVLSIAGIAIFVYSIFQDVTKYGVYFPIRTIYFVALSVFTFVTVAFITMAAIYLAIGAAILVLGYWFMEGLASPSNYKYPKGKSSFAEHADKEHERLKKELETKRFEEINKNYLKGD